MIQGIGTDIVEIFRVERAIKRYGDKFLNRLFTENEQEYCCKYRDPSPHFAGRFAAKEALVKAFGTGIGQEIGWLDIEILNDSTGKPSISFSENVRLLTAGKKAHLSISHCRAYATAFVVLEV